MSGAQTAHKRASSISENTAFLQPNGEDSETTNERAKTEFTPLLSGEPMLTETPMLNPVLATDTGPEPASNADVSEVSSINSAHSDKDWLSHIRQLPLLSSPIARMCIFLFLAGVGITIQQPSMDVIYYKLACQSLIRNSNAPLDQHCDPVQTQEIVSKYLMWDSVVSLVVSLATCTKVSTLSDIHGRKPFLTAFITCISASYYLTYFLVSTSSGFPMWGLWAATALGASTGGIQAFSALFKAYITDITTSLGRVHSMSYCLVSFSLGQIVGPLLSSVLLSYAKRNEPGKIPRLSIPESSIPEVSPLDPANLVPTSELVPLRASLTVFTIATIFCFTCLLELRSHRSRMKSRSASMVLLQAPKPHLPSLWSRIWHSITSFVEPLRLLAFPSELRNEQNFDMFTRIRWCVILLAAEELLYDITVILTIIAEPQYCIYKFKWDSVTISNYSIARSCSVIFSLGIFLPLLYKHIFPRFKHLAPVATNFDTADCLVLSCGFVLFAISHFGKALAPNGSIFVGLALMGSLGSVVAPVSAAAPVKFFPSLKVGEFYGAFALAQGITHIFAPMIVTRLFTFGVKHAFPGLAYIYTSSLFLVCLLCVIVGRLLVRNKRGSTPQA